MEKNTWCHFPELIGSTKHEIKQHMSASFSRVWIIRFSSFCRDRGAVSFHTRHPSAVCERGVKSASNCPFLKKEPLLRVEKGRGAHCLYSTDIL